MQTTTELAVETNPDPRVGPNNDVQVARGEWSARTRLPGGQWVYLFHVHRPYEPDGTHAAIGCEEQLLDGTKRLFGWYVTPRIRSYLDDIPRRLFLDRADRDALEEAVRTLEALAALLPDPPPQTEGR